MMMTTLKPEYGKNYKPGYVGFSYDADEPVCEGIAYFSRYERLSEIRVSHCFLVTGENSCVEALVKTGVTENKLEERFANKNTAVFFRKPAGLTDDIAKRLIAAAMTQVGKKYDVGLALGQIVPNLFLVRRLLSKNTQESFESWWLGKVQNKDGFDCSELMAWTMDELPEYHDRDILARPNYVIRPQQLFESTVLFETWKKEIEPNDNGRTVEKRVRRSRAVRK
jgi:hypothetical protein